MNGELNVGDFVFVLPAITLRPQIFIGASDSYSVAKVVAVKPHGIFRLLSHDGSEFIADRCKLLTNDEYLSRYYTSFPEKIMNMDAYHKGEHRARIKRLKLMDICRAKDTVKRRKAEILQMQECVRGIEESIAAKEGKL